MTVAAFTGMAPDAISASTSASKHSSRINMRVPASAALLAFLLIVSPSA
jgi:hypothetical protein